MLKFVAPDGEHWYLQGSEWPVHVDFAHEYLKGGTPAMKHVRIYSDVPPYGTIVEFKLENAEAIYELGALDYATGCYDAILIDGAIYSGVN